jgi:hypothetical protein
VRRGTAKVGGGGVGFGGGAGRGQESAISTGWSSLLAIGWGRGATEYLPREILGEIGAWFERA